MEEEDRQLRGFLPSPAVFNPSTSGYGLEKRATATRLFFQPLNYLKLDQILQGQIQLVQSLRI